MFIHFGINTFHDQEVGSGQEDPKTFDPTDLNATQWAEAAKDAGFKFVVIVAKVGTKGLESFRTLAQLS